MKKLYFIRHGQSVLNIEGKYAGRTDTPLTDEGRDQAKRTGEEAKAAGIRIDLIISSPLSRALETAQIVAKEVGYPPEKIIADERIIERDFGDLENQSYSPKHTEKYREQHASEKQENLLARVRTFLDWLESRPEDNILVVSHGSSGRALRSLVRKDFPFTHPHHLGNAELYEWL